MRKKVDERIRTLIENGANLRHRSMFFIVGDKSRDQVSCLPRFPLFLHARNIPFNGPGYHQITNLTCCHEVFKCCQYLIR